MYHQPLQSCFACGSFIFSVWTDFLDSESPSLRDRRSLSSVRRFRPSKLHFSQSKPSKHGRKQQQYRPRAAKLRNVAHRPCLGVIGRAASGSFGRSRSLRRERQRRSNKRGSRHRNSDDYRGGNARRAAGTNTAPIAGPKAESNLVRLMVVCGVGWADPRGGKQKVIKRRR